jgi:hypothetical protein
LWIGVGLAGLAVAAIPAGAAQPKPDAAGTVWLCRPGQASDPCTASLRTIVVQPDGKRHVVDYEPAKDPGIDCFYLYPYISHQTTANANLHVDPQETAIAELEASPFSQDCRVYAPMYREATDFATSAAARATASRIASDSVLRAWHDYLAHYNDGRGVVLIGHSEGSYQLTELLAEHIDQVPSVRKLLVSAIITGVDDPVYKVGFGPLETIGPCQSTTQTGCVVDFNAFTQTPPADSLFGRVPEAEIDGHPVEDICTNPADLSGGSGKLISMYRTQLATQEVAGSTTNGIFGSHPPTSSTPWIEYQDAYSAKCVVTHGYRILLVKPIGDAPELTAAPTAAWGLHIDDPNLAMGNLVALVRSQAQAYESAHPAVSTP